MPPIEQLIVGYRWADFSRQVSGANRRGGRCIDCNQTVYLNASAWDVWRDDDASCVCQQCDARNHDHHLA